MPRRFVGLPVAGSGTGTVTHTGGALTLNKVILGAGADDEKASTTATDNGTTFTYTGTGGVLSTTSGGLKAGANGSAAGVLSLLGSTSGTATFTANTTAATVTSTAKIIADAGVTVAAGTYTGAALSIGSAATGLASSYAFNTELITLSTIGTTTDSSANLLPANAIILGVAARITQTITVATDWSLGDGSTPARFMAANSNLSATTTAVGLAHWAGTVAIVQSAAAKLRITTTGTPGQGVIRVVVFYISFTPPTS